VNSDDLVEISKYLTQRQSLKNLKSEVEESRKRLKEMESSKNLKKLFMKTLEKL
jgi:uncharacterized membrane protein (DUF106 family)